MELSEQITMRGHVIVRVFDGDELVDQAEHDNLICVNGLTVLTASMLWSAAQDQNANLGGLIPVANMYPVYGALGSSNTTPGASDTQLGAELGRSVISYASSSSGGLLLTFFYPTTATPWTIWEAGVFLTATSSANNGALLNHAVLTTSVTKGAAQTATLQATFNF